MNHHKPLKNINHHKPSYESSKTIKNQVINHHKPSKTIINQIINHQKPS